MEANQTTTKKTRLEVERLKENWLKDPCYDIEQVEGFEDYKEELIEFRKRVEEKATQKHIEKVKKFAVEKGIDPVKHFTLASYIYSLESRVSQLEKIADDYKDYINSGNLQVK
jgi:acetamidase/formamidase